MKKLFTLLFIGIFHVLPAQKQASTIHRVEPPFWWTGMSDPDVQLLVHGNNISASTVTINYPGVELKQVHKADNKNFIFLDLVISNSAKPGKLILDFKEGKKKSRTYTFELKERNKNQAAFQGLGQEDVIYLVTPDRFVNGNPGNDEVDGLKEKKNRSFIGGRHGGDLEGVLSKVDYMHALGITTLWLNPVVENDMPEYSYHGYGITDYYKVDPRYGSNELYRKLSDTLHAKKMKLVMDMVFNHCGLEHWWIKDMPFSDWVHDYPDYKITNHAITAVSDPHAAEHDLKQMERGWFVSVMPDLNHDNPFMTEYLIQNSIWWIEYAGLDGIRMDTYPYNKKEFMADWAKRVYKEYPDFYLVGETWVDNEAIEAFWAGRGKDHTGFNSHLNSITDFPLCNAMHKAFKKDGDLYELYRVISKDFLYYDATGNKIFADNHDMDRIFHTLGKDISKFKQAMTFMFTSRGIPQLYYGTEILMVGNGDHGIIREDFPGGWQVDKRNAFTKEGRTMEENEAWDHIQKLLTWRRGSDAIPGGKLKHFVPYDNVYVYNRKSDTESVVVIMNNNDSSIKPDMSRFEEILKGYESGVDILTNEAIQDFKNIEVKANSSLVLVLKPQMKAER